VLAGVLPPAAGAVFLDGAAVAAAGGRAGGGAGAGRAAYMFQQDLLLPWKSVLGNATFAARMAARGRRPGAGGGPCAASALEARARRLLGEFGLGDVLGALPAELSGGMRQRVALARTLLMDRGLVLLDEPFGSLDAVTRAEMRAWLLGVMAEHPATWVLVTHDVEEAVLLGDRVAVLQGRPACLEAWTDVPLSREERRRVAARAGGRSASVPGPGVAPRGSDDVADRLGAAAAVISRALAAEAAA
jgi:ABC-type nitrate/sulfonate/bicarbonate transport system ATPase subunit